MKNITKILSVALVAMMVLSLSAVALADDTTVYIPKTLSKLIGSYDLDEFEFPTLSVKMSSRVPTFGNEKDPKDPCPYVAGEDADYLFYFSEKPDWAGAVVSSLDGGWINIDVDDSGFGMIEGPLVRQPGMWSWSGPCDPITGEPDGYGNGGDYPYYAGKDYGSYSVNVSYHRNGSAYQVVVTLKDSEDFFRTGMEGGVMSITFKIVTVKSTSNPKKARYDTYWYVDQVSAVYPEGNYIIGVEADYRNDTKQNLCSYRVSYAASEKEIYKITYSPATTTVLEGVPEILTTYKTAAKFAASAHTAQGDLHHYTADAPIYGLFYQSRQDWEDDNIYAVSGSGNKLNKWYKWNGRTQMSGIQDNPDSAVYRNNNGKQVKSIKKGTTSFKSPRVY